MSGKVCRRLTEGCVKVSLVILLSFLLPRMIPGSPLFVTSDAHALNALLPAETFGTFREYFAPGRPLWEQFAIYLGHLCRLDLGYSFFYRLPVAKVIGARLGWTLFLSLTSVFIAAGLGMSLGVRLAVDEKQRLGEFAFRFVSLWQAVPVFVTAILFQVVACYRLGWLPAGGAYAPDAAGEGIVFVADVIRHALLPLTVLILAEMPGIFMLTYQVCRRISREHFVEMAYYLNIGEQERQDHYVLRNALPELLSKLNIQFLYAISGVLFVEAVFSYPGMGMLLRVAASARDYPLLQGLLLLLGLYGVMVNFLFSLVLQWASPRFHHD